MNVAAVSGSFESASAARSGSGSVALARLAGDALVGARDLVGVRDLGVVLPLVGRLVGLLLGLILITAGCGPPS
jgi:hypothetical protein